VELVSIRPWRRAALGRVRDSSPRKSHRSIWRSFNPPTGAGLGSSAAMAVAIGKAGSGCRARRSPGGVAGDGHSRHAERADHTVSMAGAGLFTRAGGLRRCARRCAGHRPPARRDTKGRVARVAQLLGERSDDAGASRDRVAGRARRRGGGARLAATGQAMNGTSAPRGARRRAADRAMRDRARRRRVRRQLTGGGGGDASSQSATTRPWRTRGKAG
jgi:hypothetical protein